MLAGCMGHGWGSGRNLGPSGLLPPDLGSVSARVLPRSPDHHEVPGLPDPGPLIRDSRTRTAFVFWRGGGLAGSGGGPWPSPRGFSASNPAAARPRAQLEPETCHDWPRRRRHNTEGPPGPRTASEPRERERASERASEGAGHPANPRVTPAPGPLLPPRFVGRPRGGGPPLPQSRRVRPEPGFGGSDDREWEEWRHPPAALLAVRRVAPGGRVRARGGGGGGGGGVRAPGRPFLG